MKSTPTRKELISVSAAISLYFAVYVVFSLFGAISWIYGHGSRYLCDGIGHVPLLFSRNQNHFMNRLYHPLLELDRRYLHNNPDKALRKQSEKSQSEQSPGTYSGKPADGLTGNAQE